MLTYKWLLTLYCSDLAFNQSIVFAPLTRSCFVSCRHRCTCARMRARNNFDPPSASVIASRLRQQALDHLYGRAGLAQNWRKGLELLSVLANAGDDYAMAFYGHALMRGIGIPEAKKANHMLSSYL
eukprot:TRINITY_DN436_c0_g1_i2.p1 TRINITY_DN436_c0_g1~~TRINITY_DN436_c0_g1_i2.p1  ORF type:complete len:126 (-),score=13.61 TRINITY_DN436_c0_g1_i2:402-779(-)